MKIQVLGSGCASCKTLHEKVTQIAHRIDPSLDVEYSTDITKIVELGAMSSPVFAIDGKIISAGKSPSDTEIKEAITSKM